MARFDEADIRGYYDRHTPSFLRFGQGGGAGSIHRAVWGPGVSTRLQAFHYVEDQIAKLVRSLPSAVDAPHVVDLGCGVGASLCYLAGQLPIRGTGITVSPLQARLARQRIRDARLLDRVTCIEGNYGDIPSSVERADLAFAIESFVHAPALASVFASCARLIRPGGLLVVCDDVRRPVESEAAARAIDRFCRGWHVNTLLSRNELQELARASGFEHQETKDLSSALELRRVRDRAINLLGVVAEWLPVGAGRLDYLVGGSALQQCLARGWIGYELAVFRRIGIADCRSAECRLLSNGD